MPRLSIKVSDKNLIKVASLDGKRQHWCSYWIVPAIPASGTISVPASFRFSVGKHNDFFVENEAGDHKIQLFEGDFLTLVSPSIREFIAAPSQHETMLWLSKGIFVANFKYFTQYWEPAETNEKTIRELIARGTLIDSESSEYQNMAGLHSALENSTVIPVRDEKLSPHWNKEEESTERPWTHFAVDFANPDLEMIDRMELCLRGQDRAVIDTLNPSKDTLTDLATLLRNHGYIVDETDEEWIQSSKMLLRAKGYRIYDPDAPSDEKMMVDSLKFLGYRVFTGEEWERRAKGFEDRGYESGYTAAQRALRQVNLDDRARLADAFVKGFEAGRVTEYCKLTGVFTHHDREERESTAEGDTGIFREGESRTSRWSSGRGGPAQSIRRTESRSHQTTEWANSEQPCDS